MRELHGARGNGMTRESEAIWGDFWERGGRTCVVGEGGDDWAGGASRVYGSTG